MVSPTEIILGDLRFKPLIFNAIIMERIRELAKEINEEIGSQKIELLAILDGAEAFAKAIHPFFSFENQLHFMKIKTYDGLHSSASADLDWSELDQLRGKNILILEDIIDSGFTAYKLTESLKKREIGDVRLASLLHKPAQLKYPAKPDFTGFEIGPEFVVGFGMDYREQGRELKDIYRCVDL